MSAADRQRFRKAGASADLGDDELRWLADVRDGTTSELARRVVRGLGGTVQLSLRHGRTCFDVRLLTAGREP